MLAQTKRVFHLLYESNFFFGAVAAAIGILQINGKRKKKAKLRLRLHKTKKNSLKHYYIVVN